MKTNEKRIREPLFHVVKRPSIPLWKSMSIRLGAIIIAFLFSTLLASLLLGRSPIQFISTFFNGAIGTPRKIWNLAKDGAKLLCISLAVTPAFRMKFWNIGAEGQTLIGALAAVAVIFYLGGKVSNGVLLVLMFFAALIIGAIWGGIPAIFKAKWQTNETLFTLMMNYVAIGLVEYFLKIWVTSEAIAAPSIPKLPIKQKFNITFPKAPVEFIIHKYFCFPSAKIQTLRTEPK